MERSFIVADSSKTRGYYLGPQIGFGIGGTKSKSIVVDGGGWPLDLIFVVFGILAVNAKVTDKWVRENKVLFEVKVNGVVLGQERVFVRPADPNLF